MRNSEHRWSGDQEAKETNMMNPKHPTTGRFAKVCGMMDKEIIQNSTLRNSLAYWKYIYSCAATDTVCQFQLPYRKTQNELKKDQKCIQILDFCLNKKGGGGQFLRGLEFKNEKGVKLACELCFCRYHWRHCPVSKTTLWKPLDRLLISYLTISSVKVMFSQMIWIFFNFLLAGKPENHTIKVQRMVTSGTRHL